MATSTSIRTRYASAVNSKSLRTDVVKGYEGTSFNDTDTLGAMGLANRCLTTGWVTTGPKGQGYPIRPAPLAVPLERLLAGDNKAVHEIVSILAQMAFERSWAIGLKISRPGCHDMACKTLAWHRSGACPMCNGHGYDLIPGVPSLSSHSCSACDGLGKIPFAPQFDHRERDLAHWLRDEIERESGRAGPMAMRKLADSMEL